MPGLQLSNLSAERQAVLLDETVVIGANTASDLTLEKGHDPYKPATDPVQYTYLVLIQSST